MSIEHKISRSILRSTTAFELYKQDKMYYQALRIYKANKKIYKLLVQYSYSCEESILNDVHHYIFHLEDWFEQFQNFSTNSIQLEDVFVFDRLKNSIAFPSNFIHKLKTL